MSLPPIVTNKGNRLLRIREQLSDFYFVFQMLLLAVTFPKQL